MQDHRPNPTLNLEYRADRPIFMDFLQQAQRSPDAIAVVSHDVTCSYRQLEQISHGIASFLKVNGATESDRVVIVSNRWSGWWPIRCCDDGGWRFRPFVRCLAVARHALEGALRSKAEGKLTLGLMSGENQKHTRIPVGASLLAMASVQSINMLADPPLSPASQLLQGIGVMSK